MRVLVRRTKEWLFVLACIAATIEFRHFFTPDNLGLSPVQGDGLVETGGLRENKGQGR